VRRIGWLVLVLVVAVWLAGWLPPDAPGAKPKARDPWRRTVHGWELCTQWPSASDVKPSPIHPAIVAALLGLVSLLGLVAFPVPVARLLKPTPPNARPD
jgi:hypothetical protein